MNTLAVLLTSHNRKDKTLDCLRALYQCRLPPDVALKAVLVDDGSSDGTAAAVAAEFPDVIIEHGDGSLFWNRGMRKAWERALLLDPEYYLWLNDDTLLYPDSLAALLETDAWIRDSTGREGISVGSTENASGELSYGGSVPAGGLNRLKMKKVAPGDTPRSVMTMNGNCVLIPREVFARVGLLDKVFHHAMGDNDYGFRAYKADIPIYIAPGYCGRCDNDFCVAGSFYDPSVPIVIRWKKMISPKGVPLSPWKMLCKRHGGPVWPLLWVWPYGKLLLTSLAWRILGK